VSDEALVAGSVSVAELDAFGQKGERLLAKMFGAAPPSIAAKIAGGDVHSDVLVGARRADGTLIGVGYLVHTSTWGWDVRLEGASPIGEQGPLRRALLSEIGARCRSSKVFASYGQGFRNVQKDEFQPPSFVPEFPDQPSVLVAAGFVARPPEQSLHHDYVGVRQRDEVAAVGWRALSPVELTERSTERVDAPHPGLRQFRRSPDGGITSVRYDATRTDPRLVGWGSLALEAGSVDAVEATRDALAVLRGWGAEKLSVHKPLAKDLLAADVSDLALARAIGMSVRWQFVP
jgi:hypothetical protein